MQITIPREELKQAIVEIMDEMGFEPKKTNEGKTITLTQFKKKFCPGKSIDWIKEEIFYKYKPDFVADIHPGKGRQIRIYEKEAARWMEKNKRKLPW
ncbi:DUF771 domain-containing protein [uncultured Lactobacillus sp.]|uniref:DUF771 domain-containing protein n=1 Tax=uncultured Lactobacillus sp. TaxID=153152 RepID=UPI00262A36FE|nr:DUF771 domain-containing protein [uncultured Lactobacillus sp.]